jgi:putative two-component system response regulator
VQDISGMKILSVDDNQNNLTVIELLTESLDLETTSFLDPEEAINNYTDEYDLIIVDYMMPKLNGIEFIKRIRLQDKDIPIIMITAAGNDKDLHLSALESGANDFLSKPIDAPSFKARVTNTLLLRQSHLLLKDRSKLLEHEIKLATKTIIDREHETLKILGLAAEYKDPETSAHIERVAHYSKLLAKLHGQNEKFQDTIFYASPFHDIGKISIPDKILFKPGKLDDGEFEIMKTHGVAGYKLLKHSQSEYLKAGSIIALNHHEKYDGTGYPNKLKGESIPLLGRITAVVDVFDALTSQRPYKKAWSFDDASNFLIKERSKHFDPVLVDLFIENIDLFKTIYNNFKE